MSAILDIACDEAGHTGPDLLNPGQRIFGFGSVAISDDEATELLAKLRADARVQMPELKASKLLSSSRGRKLTADLLQAIDKRYAVNVHDKLLALCGWFFEYIYEPVYQEDPSLLYRKNLHRFVAMYSYLWMTDDESRARQTIEEFQRYIRSRNPADAPFLFGIKRPPLTTTGTEHPFESILRFAYGYRDIIIADNATLNTMPDGGRWTLDLSASGIWSHLNHWGGTGKLLSVSCDTSKPIQSIVNKFTGDDDDPGIKRHRANHGNAQRLGWKLAEPVKFVDSASHASVQIADIIAGTAVALFSGRLSGQSQADAIAASIADHGLADSIIPDMEIIDPATRPAAVNALILFDMAMKAERHADPYENLAAMYRAAEISWAKGEFDLIKRGEVASASHTLRRRKPSDIAR